MQASKWLSIKDNAVATLTLSELQTKSKFIDKGDSNHRFFRVSAIVIHIVGTPIYL